MTDHTACIFIYPKDVQKITRKSIRHARHLIQKIKTALGKEKSHGLTVSEFCKYMSLIEKEVLSSLGL